MAMRVFTILVAAIFATLLGFVASAESLRGFSMETPRRLSRAAVGHHCARKVVLGTHGTVVGCLIQKRKVRSA